MVRSARNPKRLFEPITPEQNRKLHAVAARKRVTDERLYARVEKLIGLPSISALSKQEAAYIIAHLSGSAKPIRPLPPRHAAQIPGDASVLPHLGHIRAIRRMSKDLGWDKQHLKNWLKKYIHVRTLRELDRKKAQSAFLGMRNILAHKQSEHL